MNNSRPGVTIHSVPDTQRGPSSISDRSGGASKSPEQEDTVSSRRLPLYGAYYGLQEPPFDLTPNPRFLFLSTRQREALSNLRYALATSKGFTLILGEAGTGKTTLVRTALGELGDTPSRYMLVNNPTLGREEFYEFLTHGFGLSPEAARSKTRFLAELQQAVEARYAAGGLTGLIIDEAQSMPHALLEEIRLLGNIETATTKLLNIVLSGQPELADRLNDLSLRQLKQRIALRCELQPLALDETAAYISGRLRIAGGAPGEIFTRETVVRIHRASAGIPRTINVLCDNALIGGFAAQVKPIPVDVVEEVCADFDLHSGVEPAAAVATAGGRAITDGRHAADAPRAEAEASGAIARPKRRFTFF
jgi:type II secretory pathway predicted ATPase ExeA